MGQKETGKPVYNAIVWQDTRTDTIVDELAKDKGIDRFRAKVGLPLATYFSATKLKWILENVPGIRTKAESGDLCFGTIDTWVIWNLTGGAHITDVTNASSNDADEPRDAGMGRGDAEGVRHSQSDASGNPFFFG